VGAPGARCMGGSEIFNICMFKTQGSWFTLESVQLIMGSEIRAKKYNCLYTKGYDLLNAF
jgi:hypothetical protein